MTSTAARPTRRSTLADGDARYLREEELDGAISDWTRRHTTPQAVEILGAAGVPVGPVYDAAAIAEDPHFQARGMVRPLKVVVEDEPEEIRFPGVHPYRRSVVPTESPPALPHRAILTRPAPPHR